VNAVEKYIYEKGRNDWLEEAAKIVQKWIDSGCVGPNPAAIIRALKGGGVLPPALKEKL
jgi:hypothetical protein